MAQARQPFAGLMVDGGISTAQDAAAKTL